MLRSLIRSVPPSLAAPAPAPLRRCSRAWSSAVPALPPVAPVPFPRLKAAEPALEEPEPPVQWTAETDLHAQRILRLESRRISGPASLRYGLQRWRALGLIGDQLLARRVPGCSAVQTKKPSSITGTTGCG
jgi:hypothetical protein